MLNLPKNVKNSTNGSLEYIYDAAGNKLAKKLNGAFVNFYCGSMVYTGSKTPEYVVHSQGMARLNGSNLDYQYNLTDHLGNVRSVASSSNTVLQSTDYFPFGLAHSTGNLAKNKYLYNGKEWQTELGYDVLDYGARMYNPVIIQWTGIDPLAEKSRRWSPYVYCYNNPLIFIDPDGKLADWYLNKETGELYFNKNLSSETINISGDTYDNIGNNKMMGDMGVIARSYNQQESQKIANKNKYDISPVQQVSHEETTTTTTYTTPKGGHSITSGKEVIINEKYEIMDIKKTESTLKKISTLESKNSTEFATVYTNITSRNKIEYSKPNWKTRSMKVIDVALSVIDVSSGSHNAVKKETYQSWKEYENKNKNGELLKHKK